MLWLVTKMWVTAAGGNYKQLVGYVGGFLICGITLTLVMNPTLFQNLSDSVIAKVNQG